MKQNSFEKQLIKLRRNKKLLWLGILFFAAVIVWIMVSLFSSQKKITISQELRELAKPLIPRLESKVFDEITIQRYFFEDELDDFPIYIFNENGEEVLLNDFDFSGQFEEEEEGGESTTSAEELVEESTSTTSTEATGSSL